MHIGIDIGGTSIKGGVVQEGEVIKLERTKTPQEKEEFVFAIKNVIQYLLEEYSEKIKGIGIGCPGPLDAINGVTLKTPNIPQYADLGKLRKEFSLPIVFNNDANCFALAEAVYGEGKEARYVLGITLGTGVGAGLVVDKKLYIGRGNALEIGHTIINNTEEEERPAVAKGCVEAYLGKVGILSLAKKQDLIVQDPIELFQLAELKNEKALAVWRTFGQYLGITLVNCIHSFDPDIIVIGGAVNQAWHYFEEAMQQTVEQHCLVTPPKIIRSSVKDAGIVGASLLV